MRWHVTRWRNSPRVLQMPLAAQGAYRNLLDAAWQQGGRLPNLPACLVEVRAGAIAGRVCRRLRAGAGYVHGERVRQLAEQ